MRYKTKYNIKIRTKPDFDSEQKDFSALSQKLKDLSYSIDDKAVINSNQIVDIKDVVKIDDNVFGKINESTYICLEQDSIKFAVLLRENTNIKNRK